MRKDISLKLKKGHKKAISPVIATIILIAVALVLALLVGVFAFGLFTSNTKNVALKSGNLYVTGPSFAFTLSNPGSSNTAIVGAVAITGTGLTAGCTPTSTVVTGGTVTSFSCAPTGTPVVGDVYDYVINLANGQSISGSVVAQ